MQRLRQDRGAVSTMVALLIVPLIGFAAIAIDVAAMWTERQQLQTGADAGALAIAQDCAGGNCGTPSATAEALTNANMNDGEAQTADADVSVPNRVTVENSGVREHLFAPVLGFEESTITASATAAWGYPTGGTAVLPLVFSWCDFAAQTGGGTPSGTTPHTILFTKTSDTGCTGPSGNVVPGGFGWIDSDPGNCGATSQIGDQTPSSPGNSPPSPCNPADLVDLQNDTVLLPIFDDSGGTGDNAWYEVYGYAAFKITGYNFASHYKWNAPCSGNDRCIRGYFTDFVELDDAWTWGGGAPDLGSSIVALTD